MYESEDNPNMMLFKKYQTKYGSQKTLTTIPKNIDIQVLWSDIARSSDISSKELCKQIASLAGLRWAVTQIIVPDEYQRKIPLKTLQRFHIVICDIVDDEPVIATSNPFDQDLLDALVFIFGSHYQLIVAPPEEIAKGIEYVQRLSDMTSFALGPEIGSSFQTENTSIPALTKSLLEKAVGERASDLHLQPFHNGSVLRIRVDGLLKRVTILPSSVADSLIRHIKAQSGMDTTTKMVPQDGRMLMELSGKKYDLRISTLPVTGDNEKLVIRFLSGQSVIALADIGFSLDEIHTVKRLAAKPSGVILVCGPTGSGKTTTLYSILNSLNDETISIMTVENPVEYQIPGISQTSVNHKAGLTFSNALRAILRQDPDVLLIGEIRDDETAKIAMQSALTGHLVLSTLHTNDSLSTIPRLLDLHINPVILAESLVGIMSQRLLRKLCDHCKREVSDKNVSAKAFESVTHVKQAFEESGCEICHFTGYKGRTVVAEVIEINQAQRDLLVGGERDIAKFKSAMRGTFNSISMSASRLIISGITTASEASRIIGHQFWQTLAREYNTEEPDLSALTDSVDDKQSNSNTVLIANSTDAECQPIIDALKCCWISSVTANTPESANLELHSNSNIDFLILDLDEELTDEQAISVVADYRQHVAWSRIPALIRLPSSKHHWEVMLKNKGATSRFVSKTLDAHSVTSIIQTAINKKLDFRWGVTD